MPLEIVLMPVADLLPYASNARTHSPEQIKKICASIKEFGFNNPILIDSKKGVIAGHGRLEAARHLDLLQVPTIELGHLSGAQKRAYILADNRLALDAGWDNSILANELALLAEDNFEIALVGFSQSEIDKLLTSTSELPSYPQAENKENSDDTDGFIPNIPDDDNSEIEPVAAVFQIRVTFEDEDQQQALFVELRDRGFKVKV